MTRDGRRAYRLRPCPPGSSERGGDPAVRPRSGSADGPGAGMSKAMDRHDSRGRRVVGGARCGGPRLGSRRRTSEHRAGGGEPRSWQGSSWRARGDGQGRATGQRVMLTRIGSVRVLPKRLPSRPLTHRAAHCRSDGRRRHDDDYLRTRLAICRITFERSGGLARDGMSSLATRLADCRRGGRRSFRRPRGAGIDSRARLTRCKGAAVATLPGAKRVQKVRVVAAPADSAGKRGQRTRIPGPRRRVDGTPSTNRDGRCLSGWHRQISARGNDCPGDGGERSVRLRACLRRGDSFNDPAGACRARGRVGVGGQGSLLLGPEQPPRETSNDLYKRRLGRTWWLA
jgi:hypothetical protein